MNAGDTYETMDITTVLGLPHWIKHRPVRFCMLFNWSDGVQIQQLWEV
jgi:hypothetical protein